MRSFIIRCAASVACIATLVVQTAASATDSCDFLRDRNQGREIDSLRDGDLYVRTSNSWYPFISVGALNLSGPSSLDLVYVVRANGERAGVLVVKSNRGAETDDQETITKRINLVRRNITTDSGCRKIRGPSNGESWVSTDAYEDYHDYGLIFSTALRSNNCQGTLRCH